MKRYSTQQLEEFLAAIDRNLKAPAEIIIIGGTAAALFYRFTGATRDIDTINQVSPIEYAIEKARKETGFNIPVEQSGVYDAPYSYADRLVEYQGASFSKLKVKGPEAIDLILMKTARAEAHDIEAIKSLVASNKITSEAIVERYREDMSHIPIQTKLLAVIEAVFGEDAVSRSEALLQKSSMGLKRN